MTAKITLNTKVVFNAPEVEDILPPAPEDRSAGMDYAAITALCGKMREQGLGDAAIVTRKDQQLHEMRLPLNWGVVKDMRTYRGTSPYVPLLIIWFKDGSASQMWPDDVIVIHPYVDYQTMERRIREQL